MTDMHSGYIVALEEDIREDDAEFILMALRMIKGIKAVRPVSDYAPDANYSSVIERLRLNTEMRKKLYEFMDENLD